MQTFLPYADFAATAAVLDERRLGKQRVEALQVLRALSRPGYGWRHHPAVLMWVGYAEALASYGLVVAAEWVRRDHPDTCAASIVAELTATGAPPPRPQQALAATGDLPSWLGDQRLHLSHRSALVGKDPAYYGPRFPDVPPDLPYYWPVRRGPDGQLTRREP